MRRNKWRFNKKDIDMRNRVQHSLRWRKKLYTKPSYPNFGSYLYYSKFVIKMGLEKPKQSFLCNQKNQMTPQVTSSALYLKCEPGILDSDP